MVRFLSKHTLPEKGFETKEGGFKAYATVLGGVLYMLVRRYDMMRSKFVYFIILFIDFSSWAQVIQHELSPHT